MPNRIIKESVNESRGLAGCTFFAQDLFKRLITYADDYGRFNADPQIMVARLYPRELDVVTMVDLMDGLIELVGVKKLSFYTSQGRGEVYGAFPNWAEHQRVRESKKKNPPPHDTKVNEWFTKRYVPMKVKVEVLNSSACTCSCCGKQIAPVGHGARLVKMANGLFYFDRNADGVQLVCADCKHKTAFDYDEVLAYAENGNNLLPDAANASEKPKETKPNLQPKAQKKDDKTETVKSGGTDITCYVTEEEEYQMIRDQNEVWDVAEKAGLPANEATRYKLGEMVVAYGKEMVLEAISASVDYSAPSLQYVKAVLENKKAGRDRPPGKKSPMPTDGWAAAEQLLAEGR